MQRPGSGSGYLLASEALENPPPPVEVTDPLPDRAAAASQCDPLPDSAHRIKHHL